jgi:hypothetical protein
MRLGESGTLEPERDAEASTSGILESVEDRSLDLSVVVLATERPESFSDLYLEYSAPLRRAGLSYEFVFTCEPWHREMVDKLEPLAAAGEPVRALEAGQAMSEASLLAAAVEHCRGAVLVVMPAYHRVVPDTIPKLVERVRSGTDVVVARRWPRRDSVVSRLQTRVFHRVLAGLLGTGSVLRDVASGVRAMRPELLREIPSYGDLARFFPAVALKEGFRVEEVDGEQHLKDPRTRIYGPGVYLRRIVDMMGVFFLLRFTYKPLRFFGLLGSVLALAGGAILALIFVERIGGKGVADRPLLLLGLMLTMFGVQAIGIGLVGEIIVHLNAADRPIYRLRQRIVDRGAERPAEETARSGDWRR